eukprot:3645683-Ditylum_brightwellii.AAC.1
MSLFHLALNAAHPDVPDLSFCCPVRLHPPPNPDHMCLLDCYFCACASGYNSLPTPAPVYVVSQLSVSDALDYEDVSRLLPAPDPVCIVECCITDVVRYCPSPDPDPSSTKYCCTFNMKFYPALHKLLIQLDN